MKTIILLIFTLTICEVCIIAQNKLITGKVLDVKSNPISYANIYIESSMEGASSSENGEFKFETSKNGVVKLIVSMIGYESYLLEDDVSKMNNLTIVLKETPLNLNEVLVQVGSFVLKGTSSIDKKGSIDVATTAGSEGDLFKAISLLPGAQVTGTDGRLLIRGGSSSESQTYIDDMHVLSPYGASAPNHQARSRYSPFFFSGVNFSMGGFSPEYSQSLSSILPLYTRDEANDSKRKYLNYPYKVQPPYVTKYNASLSIRYMNLTALRSVIAITNRIASGRPYNTPNEEVLMNGRTSVFYTTDISWTILAHKNLIIYASASNIFNRKNIYGYDYKTQPNNMAMYERKPIRLEQSQAFYIGFFLTLGKNAAYETTHF